MRWTVIGTLLVVGMLAARPSAQPQPAPKPTFEVASIKVQKAKLTAFDMADASPRVGPGGLLTATHTTVWGLIFFAYDLRPYQLAGGPEWARGDVFEINARAAWDAPAEQIRLMLRSLLEDRFRLVLHTEHREMRFLRLLLARGDGRLGPNIQRVEGDCTPESLAKARKLLPPFPEERGGAMMSGGGCEGLSRLTDILSLYNNPTDLRPVLDETGLKGGFVYSMRYASLDASPEIAAASRWPSFTTALREQLGLKLEEGRGAIDVVVIDSVQQPTEN